MEQTVRFGPFDQKLAKPIKGQRNRLYAACVTWAATGKSQVKGMFKDRAKAVRFSWSFIQGGEASDAWVETVDPVPA